VTASPNNTKFCSTTVLVNNILYRGGGQHLHYHVRLLPHITTHMLANDNWGGMMDKRIAALKPLELIFLLPLRTVRRRWRRKRSEITCPFWSLATLRQKE